MATDSAIKSINCPACGGAIRLRALGASVMVACAYCQTQIDVSKPEIQVIKTFNSAADTFELPLGVRGKLRGKTFEIIGAMRCSNDGYQWSEFLLFNPYVGFRWLLFDQGHWSFAEIVKDISAIRSTGTGIRYLERNYRKFAVGDAIVNSVLGEFYWRVKVGDRAATTDYVSAPWMLSREKTATESIWTSLQYVEPREIETAFGKSVPEADGVAPHQPSATAAVWASVRRMVWGALALALLIQIATVVLARNEKISIGSYVPPADHAQETVFGPVHLGAHRSLNQLTASSSFNNSWVDLDYALVNVETGESYDFSDEISFYSGADSDGAWTEGSISTDTMLSSLPSGNYNLVIDTASGDSNGGALKQPINLSLTHDVAPWRNFWIACGVILSYPLFLLYRHLVFERHRWAGSDFNPLTVKK